MLHDMACTNRQYPLTRISLINGRSDRKVKFQKQSSVKENDLKSQWRNEEFQNSIEDGGYGACTQDSDLEEDGLKAIGVEESQMDGPPPLVYPQFAAVKFRRPFLRSDSERMTCIFACFNIKTDDCANPIQSQIRVRHQLQDNVLGDDFGAEIESYPYKDKNKNSYFLHFFTNIERNSVAQHLMLKEYDELVLLNDEFVPNITHDKLLDRFKDLPVDSHTPLKLTIRRMEKLHDVKGMEFQWIAIQAILVPEYDKEPSTIVKNCHTELLKSAPSGTATMCLKLQDSSEYMSIQNNVIGTCLLRGSEFDNIAHITINWRIMAPSQSEPLTYYLASLCRDQNGYVSVKDQAVNLANQPFEFTYSREGGLASFMVKDKYLGYDGDTITLKSQRYRFEAFPVSNPKLYSIGSKNSFSSSHNSFSSSQSSGYASFEVDDENQK